MPEVIIKYKNAKVLDVLKDIAKYFDFVVLQPKSKKSTGEAKKTDSPPIVFAKEPDITALAGIWKDKNISLNDLRKNAWGGRL